MDGCFPLETFATGKTAYYRSPDVLSVDVSSIDTSEVHSDFLSRDSSILAVVDTGDRQPSWPCACVLLSIIFVGVIDKYRDSSGVFVAIVKS